MYHRNHESGTDSFQGIGSARPRIYQHTFGASNNLPPPFPDSNLGRPNPSGQRTGQPSVSLNIQCNNETLVLEDIGGYYTVDLNESIIKLKSPLENNVTKPFLSVRRNNGAIHISGEGAHIVIQQNWGTIDIDGLHHNIFIMDPAVQGVVRKKSGYNIRLNGSEIFGIMANPLPNPPQTASPQLPVSHELWSPFQASREEQSEISIDHLQARVSDPAPIFDHGYNQARMQPSDQGIIVRHNHPQPGIQQRNFVDHFLGGVNDIVGAFLQGLSDNSGNPGRVIVSQNGQIERITTNASSQGVAATCPICHDDLMKGGPGSSFVDCLDCFHTDCIESWIRTGKNSCPVCRNQITLHNLVV
jgi:Ring finger domain